MRERDWHFAQMLIWVKNTKVPGRRDYFAQHELVAYGWKGTHEFMKGKDGSASFYPKPAKSEPIEAWRSSVAQKTGNRRFESSHLPKWEK
jgi:DNA modification methylase